MRSIAFRVRALTILLPVLLLAGCTATGGPPPLDQLKPLLRLAVSIGTDRLLTSNPGLAPQVVQITHLLADVFDAGTFTSIAEVAAFIRSKIPWDKIGPEMRPIVEGLLAAITEELRVFAAAHQIPQTTQILLVRDIIGWVQAIAQRHVTTPVRAPVLAPRRAAHAERVHAS